MAIWKSIKGYDNQYWVSDEGQVISLGNDRTRKTRILKPTKNRKGYLRINLYKNRKLKNYRVHRLVAEAFLDNPDNLPEINHKNEDKTDNRVENIEYCDSKYNMNYGTRNQRASKKLTNHPKLSKSVLQYSLEGNFIKEWVSVNEVERVLGVSHSNITKCCKGKYKQVYGYKWEYKERAA